MSWKEILKAEKLHCNTSKLDSEEVDKGLVGNQKKIDADNDGKITGKDLDMLRDDTKKAEAKLTPMGKKIMDEVKAEGGALGMEHLYKKFSANFGGNKKSIKRTVAYLVRHGHLFQHKDGDLYTHKPTSRGRGFTAD